ATTVARSSDARVRITLVSSRAAWVTGGDALLDVVLDPSDRADDAVAIELDGRRVADTDISAVPGDGRYRVVLRAVAEHSVLTVSLGESTARMALDNHPTSGPLFAGAGVVPFVCATEHYGLGVPRDADCSAPTHY